VKDETRRDLLRTAGRALVAAALGALSVTLGLRRREKPDGYCDYSGKCGGCPVTDGCETYQAMGGRTRR